MKTETKHTPGPWTINGFHKDRDKVLHAHINGTSQFPDTPNAKPFIVDVRSETIFESETEANAHLVAAAPDMLGELLRAETIISDHVNGVERTAWAEVLAGIRAAIAKAKGEL